MVAATPDFGGSASETVTPDTASLPLQVLDALLQRSPDEAIIALDLEGQVTLWSDSASRMTGSSDADMLGHSAQTIFAGADELLRADMMVALDNGPVSGTAD